MAETRSKQYTATYGYLHADREVHFLLLLPQQGSPDLECIDIKWNTAASPTIQAPDLLEWPHFPRKMFNCKSLNIYA